MDHKNLNAFLFTEELPLKLPSQHERMAGDALDPSFSQASSLSESVKDAFLDHEALSQETRQQMSQFVAFEEPQSRPAISSVHGFGGQHSSGVPTHVSSMIPSLISLTGQILAELKTNLPKLLQLNPSRREAIAQYMDRLAGIAPGPSMLAGAADAAGGLRRWIEGPRSPAQEAALRTYFEEVALITLGQAIVMKSWSDRGIRAFHEKDLGNLNWVLSSALKPHIPLDREGWQITRPNLYSWYNPSVSVQHEIWATLESWRITDEGPGFLISLLGPARQAHPQTFEPRGYDPRLYKAIWDQLRKMGFSPNPEPGTLRRSKIVFSPTLRDGSLVRTGPVNLSWIGLEGSPFQLMVAELVQIWWGPAAPPFWAIGTGLEVHTRDQLSLALGSPKPSLLSRITEMEACDLAFVLEEKPIRPQGRSADSQRLREQLDSLPYFKKLKSATTTLGDLQSCVALNKLRPGAALWWAREESLGSAAGKEVLNFILDRAKILCEWDFSELEHSLPVAFPLFPKHLYLLVREPRLDERLNHRPQKISMHGQIRSHVELPLVLEDALESLLKPHQARGHWQIRVHKSPTAQRDWAERWPDPTSQSVVRMLDKLKASSMPLATSATIRPTPEGDASRDHAWSVHPNLKGLWIHAENTPEGRKLVALPLPRPGREAKGTGFLVLLPDENWIGPLSHFLDSAPVRHWLEHHAERRGDRWTLTEQLVRWIPIPKTLLRALGSPAVAELDQSTQFAAPLPGDWERLASEVAYHPKVVKDALDRLSWDETGIEIRAQLFVRAARALEFMQSGQNRLLTIVSQDGRIRWRDLLDVLPRTELIAIPQHPRVRMSGSLPPHIPIGRIDRVKTPSPGILLSTESGFTLHLGSDSLLIVDMIADQLEGLVSPTWSELVQSLRLPRRLELAESTASDVLRSHGEQVGKLRELTDLLNACPLF